MNEQDTRNSGQTESVVDPSDARGETDVRKPIRVTFSDLTHTGQVVASNTFPLGASFVAAYATTHCETPLDIELFKYPDDLSRTLAERMPEVACFSNFSWNQRLASHFAAKIKQLRPQTITIFGGPNYPLLLEEQHAFLLAHPEIDFHVWLEGEKAFVDLLNTLISLDLSVTELKRQGLKIPGVHYLWEGEIVRGELGPRLKSLSDIPSPYQNGMHDKFFDDVLIPMIQSNRGCPFQCTFCTEGQDYYNKVNWTARARIDEDLKYIASRVKVPDLIIVDSNFGMFQEDLDTCRTLAGLQSTHHWPKHIHVSAGKNRKERVLEAAAIVGGAINLSATIQSIDEHVLDLVKRKNISVDQILEVGKNAEKLGANSYSEIILCLPGDTRASHFRSVNAMMDAEINFLRMYQLMMLPGSVLSQDATRAQFGMLTRYRVLPRCFGIYDIVGEQTPVWEIEEICVANSTMSYQDYLDCRSLNLTVELFYNSGSFREVLGFLKTKGVPPSRLLAMAHEVGLQAAGPLEEVYAGFRQETHESLWENREELEAFVSTPGVIRRYILGEFGSNELFKYRAIGFFQKQQELHEVLYSCALKILSSLEDTTAMDFQYLAELKQFSLLKKHEMLETDRVHGHTFSFDMLALEKTGFREPPTLHWRPQGVRIEHSHSAEQKTMIAGYLKQYGNSINGLGRILLRSHVNKLHRQAHTVDSYGLEHLGAESFVPHDTSGGAGLQARI